MEATQTIPTSRRRGFNRPRPIPLLFFIAGFGLTIAMGTWQVERLAWKEGLIKEIAAANEQVPLTSLPTTKPELAALEFRKATVSGHWVPDVEFALAPRYFNGKFGYALIAPLKLTDGRIVLINRGWVPADKKSPEKRPETLLQGDATLTGMIRTTVERNYFTPENQPAKNVWFGRDIDQMAAFAQLENVAPAMLDLVGTQDAKSLPVPSDGTIRLRNDHLSYIITWYGIAAGILVIFLVYHRKKR